MATTTNGAPPPLTTTNSSDLPLFSTSLIPTSVKDALIPSGYTIRPVQPSDYNRGFLSVLATLTSTPPMSYETFALQIETMRACKDTYYILCICDKEGWVVGTGTLVVERKFIHGLGSVGHVEDIAVRKDQQGQRLGLRMIHALEGLGKNVGCYKCILDCSEANEGFYVKCGFRRAGLEMAHYYEGVVKKEELGEAPKQSAQPDAQSQDKVDGEIKNVQNAEVNIGTG